MDSPGKIALPRRSEEAIYPPSFAEALFSEVAPVRPDNEDLFAGTDVACERRRPVMRAFLKG